MPKKQPPKSALNQVSGVPKQDSINPALKSRGKKAGPTVEEMVEGIRAGNRSMLARAITLVESTLPEHRQQANEVINACVPHSGNSIRIGITGVPGVGKSTFIEAFGNYLIEQKNKRVAVLAIDPSSQKTRGSILGDKTRMQLLSRDDRAFIRPSPTSGSLGGVAQKTRESIVLCEAAGFDTVIVETVGVGQSETTVKSMTDLFLLLLLPGAGDDLQGIKKGIMEMADVILINKADGDMLKKAGLAAADVKRALHLYPTDERDWTVPVKLVSALEKSGLDEAWTQVETFIRHARSKGFFEENRKDQAKFWLQESIERMLRETFFSNPEVKLRWPEILADVKSGKLSPFEGARILTEKFKNS